MQFFNFQLNFFIKLSMIKNQIYFLLKKIANIKLSIIN